MTEVISTRARDTRNLVFALSQLGIRNPRLLGAFAATPAELFGIHEDPIVAARALAWELQLAELQPQDRVLDVGCASGYSAAILSQLVAHVDVVPLAPWMTSLIRTRLARHGYSATVHDGDPAKGWRLGAPYTAIIMRDVADHVSRSLVGQLAPGGRLIEQVRDCDGAHFARVLRAENDAISIVDYGLLPRTTTSDRRRSR
jgi:protein-L-isoaspartate O-methyltransferase